MLVRNVGIETDVIGGNHTVPQRPVVGTRAVILYDPTYPTNPLFEGSGATWFLPGCMFVVTIALIVGAMLVRFDAW